MRPLQTLVVIVLSTALGGFAGSVLAQAAYPTKPIRFIVAFQRRRRRRRDGAAARGPVERAPGTAGRHREPRRRGRHHRRGARREGAGRRLHAGNKGSTNLAAAPSLHGKLPDTVKDFTPITLLAKTPSIFAVHPSLPVKSVKELIALARARPGQINYAGGFAPAISTAVIQEHGEGRYRPGSVQRYRRLADRGAERRGVHHHRADAGRAAARAKRPAEGPRGHEPAALAGGA